MKSLQEELIAILKDTKVLYVEDDITAQEEVAKALKRVFPCVILANNGEEGLEKFKSHSPHIVITDIQMPLKNGLEMAKGIKEIAPQTPIIITTAFNDEKYFMEAIDIGIDSFLRKPILKKKLYSAIHKNITTLIYEKQKKELENLQQIQQINSFSLEAIQNLSNLFPFPVLVYEDDALLYKNSNAQKNIDEKVIEDLQNESALIAKYNLASCTKRKVKLSTPNGRNKIYWAYPKQIEAGFDKKSLHAYIFVDITMLEYQKLKLSNFDMTLYMQQRKSVQSEEETPAPQQSFDDTLDETTQSVLRKTHARKTDAKTYTSELADYFLAELDELQYTQTQMQNLIDDFQLSYNRKTLIGISKQFLFFIKVMDDLYDFKDLGYALRNISQFLENPEAIQEEDLAKLSIFLVAISEDLSGWYNNIFVDKSANDIHYLDSSLLSSCMQMEMIFNKSKKDENIVDNDLELF